MKRKPLTKSMVLFLLSAFAVMVSVVFIFAPQIEARAFDDEFALGYCEHLNVSEETQSSMATTSQDGTIESFCEDCGEMIVETVPKVSSFKLSTTNYVYNGKSRAPSVTVKDRTNKTLVKNTDYKVQYASGRTKVGKYAIKVTGLGKYSFTKMLYFYILPGQTSSITTAVNSSAVALKWNAVPGATGYRVFVLKNGAWKALKDTTGNSYKVTNLKSDTKYKFAVRAFSKVNGSVLWSKTYTTVYATTKMSVGIKLSRSSATIMTGKSFTLKATTYPTNVNVYWKSSNTAVAKVNTSGKVTGVKKGTATITAYFKYKDVTYKAACKVSVSGLVSVSTNIIEFTKGNRKTRSVTVTYTGNDNVAYDVISGSEYIEVKWAKNWNGNQVQLYIAPEEDQLNGKAKVKVYASEKPSDYAIIDVSIVSHKLVVKNKLPCVTSFEEEDDAYNRGEEYTSITINAVNYEMIYSDSMEITIDFTANYSVYAEDYFYISYRVTDSKGYVVESDVIMSQRLRPGDRSKETINLWDLPADTYTIEFKNHYYKDY